MNNKAQTSVEFVIILGLVVIFSYVFIHSSFGTFDVNKSIYKVKFETLELLSQKESLATLTKVNYVVDDTTLDLELIFNNLEPSMLTENDYEHVTYYLEQSTIFDDINVIIRS